MVLENSETVRIQSGEMNTSVLGINSVKFTNGSAVFDEVQMIAKPGSENVSFNITSNALNYDVISAGVNDYITNSEDYRNNIIATFRY